MSLAIFIRVPRSSSLSVWFSLPTTRGHQAQTCDASSTCVVFYFYRPLCRPRICSLTLMWNCYSKCLMKCAEWRTSSLVVEKRSIMSWHDERILKLRRKQSRLTQRTNLPTYHNIKLIGFINIIVNTLWEWPGYTVGRAYKPRRRSVKFNRAW